MILYSNFNYLLFILILLIFNLLFLSLICHYMVFFLTYIHIVLFLLHNNLLQMNGSIDTLLLEPYILVFHLYLYNYYHEIFLKFQNLLFLNNLFLLEQYFLVLYHDVWILNYEYVLNLKKDKQQKISFLFPKIFFSNKDENEDHHQLLNLIININFLCLKKNLSY